MRDLDILVDLADVDRALEVLVQSGYRYLDNTDLSTLSPKKRRIYERHRHQYAVVHEQSRFEVEIHWSLGRQPNSINLKKLRGRIERVKLADADGEVQRRAYECLQECRSVPSWPSATQPSCSPFGGC